ncbi:MAG: hypothetical protein WAV18_01180 [Roseiarcus sp.]
MALIAVSGAGALMREAIAKRVKLDAIAWPDRPRIDVDFAQSVGVDQGLVEMTGHEASARQPPGEPVEWGVSRQ